MKIKANNKKITINYVKTDEKAIFDRIKQIVRQNYCNYTKVRYGSKIQKIAVIGLLCSPKLVFIIGKIFRYLFPQKLYEYSRK